MMFALVLFDVGIVVSIRKFDVCTYTSHSLKIGYMWRGTYRAFRTWGMKAA